jgi:hypothetical protein
VCPNIKVNFGKIFEYKNQLYLFENETINLSCPDKKNCTFVDMLIGDDKPLPIVINKIKLNRSGIHQFGIKIMENKFWYNSTRYNVKNVSEYHLDLTYLFILIILIYYLLHARFFNKFIPENGIKNFILWFIIFSTLTLIFVFIYPYIDVDLPYLNPNIFYKYMFIIEILVFTAAFLIFINYSRLIEKKSTEICRPVWSLMIALFAGFFHYSMPIIACSNYSYCPLALVSLFFINDIHTRKKDLLRPEVAGIILFSLITGFAAYNLKIFDNNLVLNHFKWISICVICSAFMLCIMLALINLKNMATVKEILDKIRQSG